MKEKWLIGAVILVVVPLSVLGWFIYKTTVGYSGVAADNSELAKVYAAADPDMASFYSNSVLQDLAFKQPISWHRSGGRPSVTISS
jgi:hypothetical protein